MGNRGVTADNRSATILLGVQGLVDAQTCALIITKPALRPAAHAGEMKQNRMPTTPSQVGNENWIPTSVTGVSPPRAFHDSTPSQTWARTRRGERSRSRRPAQEGKTVARKEAKRTRKTPRTGMRRRRPGPLSFYHLNPLFEAPQLAMNQFCVGVDTVSTR